MKNNFPNRKPTRLKGYDYSTPGSYFITICVKDRKLLLSKIVVGDGVLDVPKNELTSFGFIAEKCLNQMSNFYDSLCVDKYVIMPNHIHFILTIKHTEQQIANGTSRAPSPTNLTLPKFISTFKRFCNKKYGENIWQRSYHDHIIRNDNDYMKIYEYINTNVIKWKEDCFYNNERP